MRDELNKAFENVRIEEEKKAVTEQFKSKLRRLSDEELDGVAGGAGGACADPLCSYHGGACHCPEVDDDI